MKLYQVDAFTDTPFRGNPAGVHISETPLSGELMQNIAAEINVAETAFVYPENGGYVIRFFTPTIEVPICGHATLSAAHIMYETGLVAADTAIDFTSKSGLLSVRKEGEWYTLNFPSYGVTQIEDDGLGAHTSIIAQELYKSSNGWYVAVVKDAEALLQLKPNLAHMEAHQMPIVLVTAKGSGEFDYFMRLFAPAAGIAEDPVTGSAECVLAPLWHQKLGKEDFVVKQLSKRSGIKKVKYVGDRVLISGQGITVFEIELRA